MYRYDLNLAGSGQATMETFQSDIECRDKAPPAPKLQPQNQLLDASDDEKLSNVSIISLPTSTLEAANSLHPKV